MKNLKYFPWMIVPIAYAVYLLSNLQYVKNLADAGEVFYQLINLLVIIILLGALQVIFLDMYYRKKIESFRNHLSFLDRTNRHLNARKQKSFMAHARDWKFKEMDQPHYTK